MPLQQKTRSDSDRRWQHLDFPSTEYERRWKGERRQSELTKIEGMSPFDGTPV